MLQSLKPAEFVIFALLALGVIAGLLADALSPEFYEKVLAAEDGPFEWATAAALFAACLICFRRAITRRSKGLRYIVVTVLGGLVLLFGAGEEISWGQRVFGWASGEFWRENNAQFETNLHNLMVGETKVNRVLFGVTLTLGLFLYFVILPLLTARIATFRQFFDHWFIPVPRTRHAIGFVVASVAMTFISSGRAPELGEYGLGLLLLAVVMCPVNRDALT